MKRDNYWEVGLKEAREVSKELLEKREEEYYSDPIICKGVECSNPIPYKKKNTNVFCGSSCAARFNNIKRGKRKEKTKEKISESLKKFSKSRVEFNDEKRKHWREVIQEEFEENGTLTDICKRLSVCISTLKSYCKRHGIELPEYKRDYIVKNALVEKWEGGMSTVKKQAEKYLDSNSCNTCGINSWEGKELPLELDHINGNRRDNRIENLRYLCPNCHSQTPTFRSKNKKHSRKISDKEFIEMLRESESINQACIKLNIPSISCHYKRARKLIRRADITHLK